MKVSQGKGDLMKHLKKAAFSFTAIFCVLGGIVTTMPVSAEEYTEKTVGDFTVREYSTYVEITKFNNAEATSTVIPAEIDGLPVLSIIGVSSEFDTKAPFWKSKLESIELPDTLINIGKFSFANLPLKSIEIPDSVKTIGNSAFMNCTQLAAAKLSDQIQTIPNQVFSGCTALESCTFPKSLVKIQNSAFQRTAFKALEFPDTLREIEYDAFYQCDKLQAVSFPDEMQGVSTGNTIFNGAFENCIALKEVHISKSMTVCGNAFKGCASLEKLTIDEGAKHNNACFDGCKSLKSLELPASFGTCPSFNNCTALTSVHFADGITTVGTFQNCINLTEINLPESISKFGNYGWDNSFLNCAKLKKVTIQNPKCRINDSRSAICNYTLNGTSYYDGTIYGAEDSTAQAYAEKYGYNFAVIGSEPDVLLGDVNLDNEITVEDAQIALISYTEQFAGNEIDLTEDQLKAADVNLDGSLTVEDAQYILIYYTERTVAGLDTTWEDLIGEPTPKKALPARSTPILSVQAVRLKQ